MWYFATPLVYRWGRHFVGREAEREPWPQCPPPSPLGTPLPCATCKEAWRTANKDTATMAQCIQYWSPSLAQAAYDCMVRSGGRPWRGVGSRHGTTEIKTGRSREAAWSTPPPPRSRYIGHNPEGRTVLHAITGASSGRETQTKRGGTAYYPVSKI